MQTNLRVLLGCTGLIALQACGGSSGSDGLDFSTTPYLVHDQFELDLVAQGARSASTPTADIVAPGSVAYIGVLELEEQTTGQSDNDVQGRLEMNVTYATNSFTGDVTEIAGRDGGQFAGALTLGNGTIAQGTSTPVLSADVNGEIENQFGVVVVVDADLEGRFTGSQGQYVDGLVNGTMTRDGTVIAIGDGDFIAEAQ